MQFISADPRCPPPGVLLFPQGLTTILWEGSHGAGKTHGRSDWQPGAVLGKGLSRAAAIPPCSAFPLNVPSTQRAMNSP